MKPVIIAHGGGFAGAVGPEKPEHLAALDRERNAVHGALGAEHLRQILNFNHSFCRDLLETSRVVNQSLANL